LAEEAEIRPPEFKRELAVYLARDRERWLRGRGHWVSVPCPACGQKDPDRRFSVRDYPFAACAACGTVYQDPRPTAQQLADYYANAESYRYWAETIFPATAEQRRRIIAGPLAERLAGVMVQQGLADGLLVEIGAGAGLFLEEARARNLCERYLAVEPAPDLAAVLQAKGFEVRRTMAAGAGLVAKEATVVCAFEVIEHVFSPRLFLTDIAAALKTGGLVALSCPNIRGFDFQVLGYDRAENFGLEHINMFHPESLHGLLKQCGFAVVETATPGRLDADLVRRQILDGRLDVAQRPFLRRVLVDDWERLGGPFQEFLRTAGMSSNLVVMARKTVGAATGARVEE